MRFPLLIFSFCILHSAFCISAKAAVDWPDFPLPKSVIVVRLAGNAGDTIALQTLSGVLSNALLRNEGNGESIYCDTRNAACQDLLKRFTERTKVPTTQSSDNVWTLARRFHEQGILKGYVLYAADKSRRRPYDAPRIFDGALNVSSNIATSMCGPLRGIAVSKDLEEEAKKAGLEMLADASDKDYAWLFEHYGKDLNTDRFCTLDPKAAHLRDFAVATNSVVTFNVKNGGLDEASKHVKPGSIVLGWGIDEGKTVTALSEHGVRMMAANWSVNIPLMAAGAKDLEPNVFTTPAEDTSHDAPDTKYVAMVLSDGDNLQWATNGYFHSKQWWTNPDRGKIPFTWGVVAHHYVHSCPDVWSLINETKTDNDDVIDCGLGGYQYLDQMSPELIAGFTKDKAAELKKLGVNQTILFAQDWNCEAAHKGYDAVAANAPDLPGAFVLQYDPYPAGQGKIYWAKRPGGPDMPVLSARADIWDNKSNEREGPPLHTAELLNKWAKQPATAPEEKYAWVIVHCWTDFGKGNQGISPAIQCANALDKNIKLVKPRTLFELLNKAHDAK